MARSNLAYKQEALEQSYDAQPILPRPKLRTIEGQGRTAAAQPQTAPWMSTLLVMGAALLIVLATTSVFRVSIANATVQMMQTSEQTQAAIDQARAVGLELEVLHSLANNPTRIQDAAASFGILPTSQPATIPALSGFTQETKNQMASAAEEAKAAELSQLQAGTRDALSDIKAISGAVKVPTAGVPEGSMEAEADVVDDAAASSGDQASEPTPDTLSEAA